MDYRNYFNNNVLPQVVNNNQQIQFYYVNSLVEAQAIQIQFNTIYFIVNKTNEEVYIKQLNRDGLVDFEIYKNEKNIKSLNDIEERFNNKINVIVDDLKEIKSIVSNYKTEANNKKTKNNE